MYGPESILLTCQQILKFLVQRIMKEEKDRFFLKLNCIKKYINTFAMPLRVVFVELNSPLPATKADFVSFFLKGKSSSGDLPSHY